MELCADKLREIDGIQEYHQQKMIKAFQQAGVRESYFSGTTGYGYDDFGRDALDKVYAFVFDAEDALVRHNFVSGTHALTVALFGMLRPKDTILSVTGMPYDTIRSAIGIEGDYPGSLKDFDISFEMTELLPDGEPDFEGIERDISEKK
ncbi:MAG: methionine gamma-lyase family protein, partial [Ruminococcus sp.]|nr:methionine gamma-lyase family protein [Ruminococcus sp.]